MSAQSTEVPLVASPYDLRVSLGEHVSEPDIETALKTGELGFVHSFTTGSAVDGPGVQSSRLANIVMV
jgi:pyruvate formate lyase activating enzyme